MYGYRPSRIKLKDVLIGDIITVFRRNEVTGVDLTVGGLVTDMRSFNVSPELIKVTLGKGHIDVLPRTSEVRLHKSLLRDEGIAMVVGGSPTFNVTYVRVVGCLYRVTYDWMTDKATRTSVDSIPAEEQMLESVGKIQSNRESKIRISMDVPLTQSEVTA